MNTFEILKKKRLQIYNQLIELTNFFNKYLIYCCKRTSCSCTLFDKLASKKICEYEKLVNELKGVNDLIEVL